ncbi:ABC transporter permease [Bradyrhizobium sp. Ash2021]|uniref:ABC transporter permease n=1 Tax=Bradyrhizobium sp. Ash2021 TaxID=2954771 RepID=UPI002816346F|nr:ABC transporter permease [Bradyrhizobium sp. Ash2021]WMT78422.1 ABC transporter permease [Bradyrhizobium sp. Ash2021]
MKATLAVLRNELHRILTLRPAFSVLVVATILYAAFYPQPYVNEALRDLPIAIVDRDNTLGSRELARRVDATPDVAITMALPDLATAEREVFARRISGILLIPQYFERDLLHGRPSPVALYADASYFLTYQRISGGVSAAARTLGTEVETARLIAAGVEPAFASAAADPMPLTAVALFNPQAGYATYLLPAAFVLLLQQTLLIGVGLLGTLPGGRFGSRDGAAANAGPLASVAGKLLAYLVLEAVVLPFYLIVLPYLYGLPRLGSAVEILILALPFVLAVSGLGMVIAAIFRSPLAVQLAFAAIGLPFFFLAGFAWPPEAIPHAIRIASILVPSSAAIDGFVKLSQLGAPLFDARSESLTLWALAILYGGTALALEIRDRRASRLAPA